MLEGHFQLTKTVSDLLIHLSDNIERESGTVSCERSSELTIGVLLEGKLNFTLGGKGMSLEVLPGQKPRGFLFNTLYSARWVRQLQPGCRVIKALLCLPHPWLAKRFRGQTPMDGAVQQLMLSHCALHQFETDKTLQNLANTLIVCGKSQSSEVELEGLALTMMADCLKKLNVETTNANSHLPGSHAGAITSRRICQYVEQNIIEVDTPLKIDLSRIANDLGISISTAQRQFKADRNLTIMEYIRHRRLDKARRLLHNQLSIGEVAYCCGYSHSSNFSLAFKRHFGVSPGDICGK